MSSGSKTVTGVSRPQPKPPRDPGAWACYSVCVFGPEINPARVALFQAIRAHELDRVARWLTPGKRVLELGANDGYQAKLLADRGCLVTAIDVGFRPTPAHFYFPVVDYDGVHLPFTDGSFDVVFSSNVLEHVQQLPELLADTRRVLAPGGIAVHVLPSSSWRWWTIMSYYAVFGERAAKRVAKKLGAKVEEDMGLRDVARKLAWPEPHGEYPNAYAELYYFSRRRWRKVFSDAGFEITEEDSNRLFYSGYSLFPNVPLERRKKLSSILGPSCSTFVLRRAG